MTQDFYRVTVRRNSEFARAWLYTLNCTTRSDKDFDLIHRMANGLVAKIRDNSCNSCLAFLFL